MNRQSDFLMHYGVKGQKWGIRRYQNDDGTLTAEGKIRYGGSEHHEDKGFLRKTVASEGGAYAFAKFRERRHRKNLAKAQEKGNEKKIEKYQSKLDAQSAANRNLAAYREHSSTGKLFLQNYGMAQLGLLGSGYRHARARGEDRLNSMLETVVPILRNLRDKKAYGKYIVYGDETGENFSIELKK